MLLKSQIYYQRCYCYISEKTFFSPFFLGSFYITILHIHIVILHIFIVILHMFIRRFHMFIAVLHNLCSLGFSMFVVILHIFIGI